MYTFILMLLLLAFFAYHQWKNTGFFTYKFGRAEMLALYLPILISLGPPIQRLIQGRRNPARPLEAVTDLSLAIGSL
jgi:TRAP-type C4-dicarboxylate transport system permease small subunit